jgi:uncharacterized membrane protein
MIILFIFVAVILLLAIGLSMLDVTMNPLYLMMAIVLVFIIVFGAIYINQKNCTIDHAIITELYAGYNNSEIEGHFFLGSGSVNEKEMVYYWANNDGIKSKHSQEMSMSVFIEDGKNIMVEKYHVCPDKLQWLFINPGLYQIEFHVPENSIVQMYQYQ